MFETLSLMPNPGVELDTLIHPISEVASDTFFGAQLKLFTVSSYPGTESPPPGSHFFTLLLFPSPKDNAKKLIVVNSLFSSWIATTPLIINRAQKSLGCTVIRVRSGQKILGNGLFMSLFLFDRPVDDDNSIITLK